MITSFLRRSKNFLYFIEVKRYRKLRIPPRSILFPVIWVTNRCNLRCRMCDQWKTDPARLSGELSTQEWYAFIDSASRMHAVVIIISGGEPLLREDIFDIIRYACDKGIACHLCSNGTMLDDTRVRKFKDAGLKSISVSLDSYCAEVHNELRGVECFDAIVNGIRLLRKVAYEIKIGINYVITKRNFHDMDRMVSFAEGLGVEQIKFDLIYNNLAHRQKPILSFADLLFNKDDLPELRIEINKLIHAISRTNLLTNSHTFIKGIPDAVKRQKQRLSCYAGYISCAVDAFGRVSPCDNFDGNENLRDKSLEEIWHSPHFQQMRKMVDDCDSYCWDTTHTELNIRCSSWRFIKELGRVLKETRFYTT